MFAWFMRVIRWLMSLFRRRKPIDSAPPGLGLSPGGGGHQRPRDPLAGVRQPIARRPGGNSASVAVEEPHEDEVLMLIGASG
jgi:hypothetical protein